ncbi:MAG: universal stress protein [Thermomicrobiales bacterium]|nr:universal stress protein [Thermomicrobiales bacterium]
MFTRIVIPLDGSETAEGALPEATELARTLHVPLCLLRVVDLGKLESYGAFGLGLEYSALDLAIQDERATARDYLEKAQQRLTADGLHVITEIREGLATNEIVSAAEPDDLLVMASHGRSGLSRWFLGSVAESVMRKANVPVMLVRVGDRDRDGGLVEA